MAGLDVEALGESHGIEHHQRLQENRKTREISMTQKQKPAPALPDSVVRDALATLHLNLPPGREEAMVKLLQAHALNERGPSLEEALRHEGDYVRGAMRALGGLLVSLDRNRGLLDAPLPTCSLSPESERLQQRLERINLSFPPTVSDNENTCVSKDEVDPKKRASGRFRFFKNFAFPTSRGTPRSLKRANSLNSSSSGCRVASIAPFSPIHSIPYAASSSIRNLTQVSGGGQDGSEGSRMVGEGREEDNSHSVKLVETREVGCNTTPPYSLPCIETKHQSGDHTKHSSATSLEKKTTDKEPELRLIISHGLSPLRPLHASSLDRGNSMNSSESITPHSLCSDVSSLERAKVKPGLWRMGHQIGKGSFGSVHIGLNEVTGDLIAVKVLSLCNPHTKIVKSTVDALYREIQLMRNMNHENIVSYLGAELQAEHQRICIFQEWVPGSITSLLDNFGPFGERRIAQYTKQILHGLVYLHDEGVMHRDIKGSNILIDDRGIVKLCDFGASKVLHCDDGDVLGVGDHTRVGSPLFMAPEVLLKQEYGQSVDIWSLGGAVLQMKTGTPPWSSLNLKTPVALIQWIRKSKSGPPLPEDSDTWSPALRSFLGRCFIRDPTKRPTAHELLSDPFLEGNPEITVMTNVPYTSAVSDIESMSPKAAINAMQQVSISAKKAGGGFHTVGDSRGFPTCSGEDDGTRKHAISSRRVSSPGGKRSGLPCITDPQKLHPIGSSSIPPHPVTPISFKDMRGVRRYEPFGSPTQLLSPTGDMCFTPGGRHYANPYSGRKRSISINDKDGEDGSVHGHSVGHNADHQLVSTSCRGTPRRSARHDKVTYGTGRENQDSVTAGLAASHFGTINENVAENKRDGDGGDGHLTVVTDSQQQQPRNVLGGKTEENLVASDRLASPIRSPLGGGGNVEDENANGMTYELKLEPRKLYTNPSTAPPSSQSSSRLGGGLPKMKNLPLGQKSSTSSSVRKNSVDKTNTMSEHNAGSNLLPRGRSPPHSLSNSESTMCPVDLISSPPGLGGGVISRRNSRDSKRDSRDSQRDSRRDSRDSQRDSRRDSRDSRRDSTNSECENMFLSLAVEECLTISSEKSRSRSHT